MYLKSSHLHRVKVSLRYNKSFKLIYMKQILTTIFSLIIFVNGALAQIPSNGLIGNYPFSGNANDLTGSGNNGVITNATLTTDRFGNANSAYSFNGSSSYLRIANNPLVENFSNSFSFSFWINQDINNSTNREQIFSTREDVNANDLGSWDYYLDVDTIYTVGFGVKVKADRSSWVNIIYTYNATTHCLLAYKNGVLISQGCNTNNNTSNSSPIQIGASMYNDGTTINPNLEWRFFQGKLDDFLFYNRILSSTEVSNIYSDGYCKTTVTVMDTLMISSTTGINSISPDFGTVKIYPNPSNSLLNIAVSKPSNNYTLKIFNSSSSLVYSEVLNTSSTQISLSSLGSAGLYIIQIYDTQNNILDTRKLIYE
jgi:hypothetical protein